MATIKYHKDCGGVLEFEYNIYGGCGDNGCCDNSDGWVCAKCGGVVDDDYIEEREIKEIFTFGSNLAGKHGKGAALFARQNHGANYGQGIGLQGNSYAIPTKDENIKTLPLAEIKKYVAEFIVFANNNPEMQFNITAIGCGLAGYKPEQIAPMFKEVPDNCILPEEFKVILKLDSTGHNQQQNNQ